MYDMTTGLQFASAPTAIPGLWRTQAYPYLTDEGVVYDLAHFEEAASFRGHSGLDWEPSVLEHTEGPGTVGVVADAGGSIVTITGGTFPNYDGHSRYKHRFYVNGTLYPVASWTDSTHLRLVSTSVNVTSGTAFKYARWNYREVDPKYAATGELAEAHNELANALMQVESIAQSNCARLGIYDFLVHTYRRDGDIAGAGYAEWQDNVAESLSFVTSQGWTIADFFRRNGGKVFWTAYVPVSFLDNLDGWLLRNQRVMETMRSHNMPNAPIFRKKAIGTLEDIDVPNDFLLTCIDDVEAYQPGEWGFWGPPGEFDSEFVTELSDYATTLPKALPCVGAFLGR